MNLPFSSFFAKKEKIEYFLALLLREEKVNAVIFKETKGVISLIGQYEKELSSSIEQTDNDDLLKILDEIISTAENALPNNIETHKTIFGLKENWVEGQTIKKEYLTKLKKISDELDLSPIGFLVIQEAIAHLLQKEEGVPLSAILIETGVKNLAVSLVRAGRVLETKRTKLEDSIPKTTDRLLHHFTSYEVLPSRIIIYNEGEEEELSQEFISHTFSKSLPFLHVPQITVLPKNFDAQSVVFGASVQMGFEILDEGKKELDQNSEGKNAHKEKALKNDLEESRGSFGFKINQDISPPITVSLKKKVEEEEKEHFAPKKIINLLLHILPSKISSIFSKIKPMSSPPALSENRKIIIVPLLIILIGIIMILLYVFKLKADVSLSFRPEVIEDQQEVTFSAGVPTDVSKSIIQANIFDITQDGQQDSAATGAKEVGEKAKGTVTIKSSLTNSQSIPAGTNVTSSNGLIFITDKDIQLASSSGITDIKSQQISITAQDIGKEYNLPSKTVFSVGSFDRSSVGAENDAAFSGGSKKEVTIITADDVDRAEETLIKKLEEKAKEEALKKISDKEELLPVFISSEVTKKDLNKDIGDEANTVILKGTVNYKAISYNKEDLGNFAKNILSDKQNNKILSEDGLDYEVNKIEKSIKNDNNVEASLTIKASFIPEVDTSKLSKDVKGKTFEEAQALLFKLPQASDVRITLVPNIPFLPRIMPRFDNNIQFFISAHE